MWDFNKYINNIAFITDDDRKLSYGELEEAGTRLVDNIREKSLVFHLCRNDIGSVLGYTAFLNGRIVPLLLNYETEKELVDVLIKTYKPDYLWIPDERKHIYEEFLEVYESYGYTLLKNRKTDKHEIFSQLALLLTTSGSTGSPKFVRQSYLNIESNTKAIVKYLELNYSERPITSLPMNYTYGLSILNSHLSVGATILLTEKSIMQKEFWQFFKEQGATSIAGVPYTYEMLDKLRFYRMDLPSLKTMTQAGGKLTPELHEKFAKYAQETGKKFVVMYGQCEATARMGYLPPEKAVEKKGSMGVAIPGGKFSLIDEEGKEIKTPHTTGELIYEGENVTLGYAECSEDLAKGDERHGILATGDMAQFDEDGYYYIVGRKKRFLKIYGNRVNLDEVERLIKSEYKCQCAVSGIDDHMYIFVTKNNIVDELAIFISNKTKLNHKAFNVEVIKSIPQNDAGKTLYKNLERYYIS